jgi:hypothetical protein
MEFILLDRLVTSFGSPFAVHRPSPFLIMIGRFVTLDP